MWCGNFFQDVDRGASSGWYWRFWLDERRTHDIELLRSVTEAAGYVPMSYVCYQR